MRKRSLCLLFILFSGFAGLQAQQVNNFSVQDAVTYARKNSVQVRNALLDVQIQKQVNREITSAAYPNLNGSVTVIHFPNVAVQTFPNFIAAATYGVLAQEGVKDGNGNTITPPSDFGVVQAQFGTKYSANAGVDLSQLLFDGQVFVGLQARRASIDFYEKQVAVTEELIDANVRKVYYQLVVANKQVTSIDANITRFEKLLADTREIYKQGFAERLDIDKVSVQLSNLQTEKIKLQNQINVGNEGLKFLMHMPQKDSLVLTDTLSEDMITDGVMDNNYQASDRKEYQLLQTARSLGKYNIKRYELSYLPTVALFGNYAKQAQRNKPNFFDGPYFTSSTIGLKLTVPIFDGFARASRVQKAKLELQKTDNNIEELEYRIANEVKTSTLAIASAIASMQQQRKNMELAEQVYLTTKYKYEQGLGSNQEIYTAQAELKVAQNNYYSSLYDAITARIDYLKATGKLNP